VGTRVSRPRGAVGFLRNGDGELTGGATVARDKEARARVLASFIVAPWGKKLDRREDELNGGWFSLTILLLWALFSLQKFW